MLLREVMDAWELIDRPDVTGEMIETRWQDLAGSESAPRTCRLVGDHGATDVVTWRISGANGLLAGGSCPTLAVIGRLGGLGARPRIIGTVSDADGAVIAIATALKLARSRALGEPTPGDVVVVTHICPNAPTRDFPVAGQMASPVPMEELLPLECPPEAAALLSVDTTRGHLILNHTGIAMTPTVLGGYILRVSEDLMQILTTVTNDYPVVLPITTQDLLADWVGAYRINSILQPATLFEGPVVGIATTARAVVGGSATSASSPNSLEAGARFCTEVARKFGSGGARFYSPQEYRHLVDTVGDLRFVVRRRPN